MGDPEPQPTSVFLRSLMRHPGWGSGGTDGLRQARPRVAERAGEGLAGCVPRGCCAGRSVRHIFRGRHDRLSWFCNPRYRVLRLQELALCPSEGVSLRHFPRRPSLTVSSQFNGCVSILLPERRAVQDGVLGTLQTHISTAVRALDCNERRKGGVALTTSVCLREASCAARWTLPGLETDNRTLTQTRLPAA